MKATSRTYIGLTLVTLATLMFEVLLTRIFSATMWYHFAFMALSLVMFGMTVGALIVYARPNQFTAERANKQMAESALLLGISILLAFCAYIPIRFMPTLPSLSNFWGTNVYLIVTMAYIYGVFAIPFLFSGICTCIALTKFPEQTSKLYAADLIGAAIGCPFVIFLIDRLDIASTVLVVAALACLGALACSLEVPNKILKAVSAVFLAGFLIGACVQFNLFSNNQSCLRLKYTKGAVSLPLVEKWSALSCIRVSESDTKYIWSWGINPDLLKQQFDFLVIDNDSSNGTLLHKFDGDLSKVDFLKLDITNFAHHMRPHTDTVIIGVGGGRDVLSAIVFGDKSITGVELNPGMLYILTQKYGDFAGHLDKYPNVRLVNDEARSYITRSGAKYGIIQASLIDTSAASAAGAFAHTENSLYTVDGWKIFMDHLADDGVITFSRPYTPSAPNEIYRLLSLAGEMLRQKGIKDPRSHMLLIGNSFEGLATKPGRAATLLVCKSPFTEADLRRADEIAKSLKYEIIFSKEKCKDPVFATLASPETPTKFLKECPLNFAPPTDNCPFFFNFLTAKHLFSPELWTNQGYSNQGYSALTQPMLVMFYLIAITVSLTLICIAVPLWMMRKETRLVDAFPLIGYFSCIGFGFMFIEVSVMQTLTVFLGSPTYGLTVVLFTLLLAGGIGSYTTNAIKAAELKKGGMLRLSILLVALVVTGLGLHPILNAFVALETWTRILLCGGLITTQGLLMGMAFPLGMRVAQNKIPKAAPWLWGVNGATSVCASVFAAFLALNWGMTSAFWTGAFCYLLALVFFMRSCGSGQADVA